jgi:hypothetical protein
MRVCEARNWSLEQAQALSEEELVLIVIHSQVEADIRKETERKNKRRNK